METIWLELESNEMMTDEFMAFILFLDVHDMKRTTYIVEDYLIFEVTGKMTDKFNTQLGQLMLLYPITQSYDIDKSIMSNYDIWKEMSNIE